MKVTQTKTPEDFEKITKTEMYKLWFGERLRDTPLTDKQIGIMYGVSKEEVKAKRKELGLNWLGCGFMYLARERHRK